MNEQISTFPTPISDIVEFWIPPIAPAIRPRPRLRGAGWS